MKRGDGVVKVPAVALGENRGKIAQALSAQLHVLVFLGSVNKADLPPGKAAVETESGEPKAGGKDCQQPRGEVARLEEPGDDENRQHQNQREFVQRGILFVI